MPVTNVPFIYGEDAALDSRIVPAGVLDSCENVRVVAGGRLAKRAPYQESKTTTTYTPVVMAPFRGDLVACMRPTTSTHGQDLRGFSSCSHGAEWLTAKSGRMDGTLMPLSEVETTILRATSITGDVMSAANSAGRVVHIYATTPTLVGPFGVQVFENGRLRYATTVGTSSCVLPRAFRFGSTLAVGYLDAAAKPSFHTVGDAALSSVTATQLTAGVTTGQAWDVCPCLGAGADYVAFVVAASAGNDYEIRNASTTYSLGVFPHAAPTTYAACGAMGDKLVVSYVTGTDVMVSTLTISAGTWNSWTAGTISTNITVPVTVGCYEDDGGTMTPVLVSGGATGTSSTAVYNGASETTGALVATILNTVPASAIFNDGHSPLVVLRSSTYDLRRVTYIYGVVQPYIVARLSWGEAYHAAGLLPRPYTYGTYAWHYAHRVVISADKTATVDAGLAIASHRIVGRSGELATRAGVENGSLLVSGGLVQQYDGQQWTESGWMYPPGTPSVGASAGTSLAAGTYSYVVTWEYVDALGDLHRSPPSTAFSFTAATATNATLQVGSIQLTNRTYADVYAVAWRTTNLGSVYYRVGSVACTTPGATLSIVDGLSDANLQDNEALDTYLGALESWMPDPCACITKHGARVWIAHGTRLYYSHEKTPGRAVEFVALNAIDMPGRVTGLASHAGTLIVTTESEVYAIHGEGPDRTGANGEFSRPELIGRGGCALGTAGLPQPGTMRETGHGLVWVSSGVSGLSLKRMPPGSIQIETISDPIDSLTQVYSIDDQPDYQRLRVTTTIGIWTLHYGESPLVWSFDVITGLPGSWGGITAAAVRPADTTLVRRTGHALGVAGISTTAGIYVQAADGTNAADEVAPAGSYRYYPSMVISTRAIYPGGRGQEYRVRRVYLDGEMAGATGSLSVAVWHDSVSVTRYTAAVSGVTGELAQQVQCGRQRCTSVRVRISDDGTQSMRGFELAGLQLIGEPTQGREQRALGPSRRI